MMAWKKSITVAVLLGVAILALARLRVYYTRDGAVGDLVWNSNESYIFVKVFQYGYDLSYLGYLGEIVKDFFPFGASPPDGKHYYGVVLHITPEAIQHYSFDNFEVGDVFAVGETISAGTFPDVPRPMKWSGTHFEPMTSEEEKRLRDGAQKIPPGPSYDDIAGWSKRKVDLVSPEDKDTEITIELGGRPLTLRMHSGFTDHEARIGLRRPGIPSETIWHLNENSRRVSKDTYKHTFGGTAHVAPSDFPSSK
jgi:hypothetical protein